MKNRIRVRLVDRRCFMLGAAAAASLTALSPIAINEALAENGWDEFRKTALEGAVPAGDRIHFQIPETAENGAMVSYAITVDSPMTPDDHVTAIDIYAPANPIVQIISVRMTPASGKAYFKSRMRLAKSQEVVAVARMNDGRAYVGKVKIKVLKGGCGG